MLLTSENMVGKKAHPIDDVRGVRLVMIICNHCPYVKAVTKVINAVLLNSNPKTLICLMLSVRGESTRVMGSGVVLIMLSKCDILTLSGVDGELISKYGAMTGKEDEIDG